MATKRTATIFIIGTVAMLTALILPRMRPTADASNRIRQAYQQAEKPVLRSGSDIPEAERFAEDLKAIDLTGAPQDVRDTMAVMIRAVEENLIVRRAGGDTNAANDNVGFAKRDLLRALDRGRGQPY